MSTPEERLAALLRAEADTLVPAGDGLSTIQARVVRRKRARFLLLPGAALAVSGAAAAFFLLGPGTGPTTLTQQPGGQPTATGTAFCLSVPDDRTCPSEAPTPTPSIAPVVEGEVFPAIWPFTSASDSEAWDRGAMPWASDAAEVARRFRDTFLAGGLKVEGAGPTSFDLVQGVDTKVGTVMLRQYTPGTGPWTVTGVSSPDLSVTRPAAGAALSSPFAVTGRVPGADESIRLSLVDQNGREVTNGQAQAGGEEPWSASLRWSSNSWTTGALLAITSSGEGTLNRVVAVPVVRANGATAGPVFAALTSGHVSLFDATNGSLVKQLTFPPAGAADSGIAYASGSLAWIRSKPTGCHDSLNRLDGGDASNVVPDGQFQLAGPRFSPSGALLAWTRTPCGGDRQSIVVRGGGAPDRVLVGPTGMSARVLDVTDDGALLVHLNDLGGTNAGTIGRLAPGAQSLDGLKPLSATGSCYLAGAATFADDDFAVAWETCEGRSRLARFGADGARLNAGPLVDATVITTTAYRDGAYVLEVRSRSGGPTVARYRDETLTYLTTCDTGSTTCIGAPDW